MEFKNKAGTVDPHNVNFNFKPDNTDSYNIILNFEVLADGSANLNFGDDNSAAIYAIADTGFSVEIAAFYADSDANTSVIDTIIDTGFAVEIDAVFAVDINIVGSIDTVVDTSFITEIEAVFSQNLLVIDTIVDTDFNVEVLATFDINFILGVSNIGQFSYQKSKPCLISQRYRWAKPIFKAHNSAFYFERSLVQAKPVALGFDKAQRLAQAVKTVWQQGIGLSTNAVNTWDITEQLRIKADIAWQVASPLAHQRTSVWQEMIRKRKVLTYAYEVAQVFEKQLTFKHDVGLELIVSTSLPWDKAKAVHYRKHKIEPWPEPVIPKYVGSTDLNFLCLLGDVDSHNVILNFAAEDCIPQIAKRNWWHIVNEISVTRLDNGQPISVMNGSFDTDRSRWCWSYKLTVPASELYKLNPIGGLPVILKIMVNGFEHHMLLENRTRSRQFAKDVYSLSGRSPSALLSPPYAPVRSFTQENERTSVQLAQAELDRVNSDIVLNWQLIDPLGWVLPANSASYGNSTPIGAISTLVEAGGGFVYSEPDSQTLSIKPLYKKTYWDSLDVGDYDRLIPESIVTDLSTDYEPYPDYNGVWLTNDRSGLTGQVKRTGTAGDNLQQPYNSTLLTSNTVMHSKGRAILAKAGMVEYHSLQMPIHADVGLCEVGELVAFNGEWWGIVDSVSVSFNFGSVTQTVSIERVNHE